MKVTGNSKKERRGRRENTVYNNTSYITSKITMKSQDHAIIQIVSFMLSFQFLIL